MLDLIEHELKGFEFTIGNPLEDEKRGGHIYLEHAEAARICKALKANGVIPDFKAPNGVRFAPLLYTIRMRKYDAVQDLKENYEK